MKYCGNCGKEMEDSAVFCENCGAKNEVPAQADVIVEQPASDALPVKDRVLSIIGMVLGIVALVWAFVTLILALVVPTMGIAYSICGYIFAIPGMILSCIGNKSGKSKMAKIGKIFSLICLILFAVLLVISIIVGVATDFSDLDVIEDMTPNYGYGYGEIPPEEALEEVCGSSLTIAHTMIVLGAALLLKKKRK